MGGSCFVRTEPEFFYFYLLSFHLLPSAIVIVSVMIHFLFVSVFLLSGQVLAVCLNDIPVF